jgi:hypothetical protein
VNGGAGCWRASMVLHAGLAHLALKQANVQERSGAKAVDSSSADYEQNSNNSGLECVATVQETRPRRR